MFSLCRTAMVVACLGSAHACYPFPTHEVYPIADSPPEEGCQSVPCPIALGAEVRLIAYHVTDAYSPEPPTEVIAEPPGSLELVSLLGAGLTVRGALEGVHTLTVRFPDGEAQVSLEVAERAKTEIVPVEPKELVGANLGVGFAVLAGSRLPVFVRQVGADGRNLVGTGLASLAVSEGAVSTVVAPEIPDEFSEDSWLVERYWTLEAAEETEDFELTTGLNTSAQVEVLPAEAIDSLVLLAERDGDLIVIESGETFRLPSDETRFEFYLAARTADGNYLLGEGAGLFEMIRDDPQSVPPVLASGERRYILLNLAESSTSHLRFRGGEQVAEFEIGFRDR